MEDLARANLIFGLHVHVGIEDREMQILIMNAVRGFLPHLLALSVNSTVLVRAARRGVKSVRSTIFKRFRARRSRTSSALARVPEVRGPPRAHELHRRRQEDLGDVRPHAHFKTLEFRICDIPSRMERRS